MGKLGPEIKKRRAGYRESQKGLSTEIETNVQVSLRWRTENEKNREDKMKKRNNAQLKQSVLGKSHKNSQNVKV